MIFINILSEIQGIITGINPMGLGSPWDDDYLKPQQKINLL